MADLRIISAAPAKPDAAPSTAPGAAEDAACMAAAFLHAPFAPFAAMAQAQWKAQAAFALSQSRFAWACARTLADAWRDAGRRHMDVVMGQSFQGAALRTTDGSGAVAKAAAEAKAAGQELVVAQSEALERVRRSA